MKTPISMWQVGVAASLLLLGQLAAAGPGPDVSTAGFGDAKFGMDIEAVERALGRVLVMPKGKSKAQVRKMECSYASVSDLPGVDLRFENGRFMYVSVDKPTVTTRSGFKVGDPERMVIDRLKTDSTYERYDDPYDETKMHITVGKIKMVGTGATQKIQGGYLIQFVSKQGRVILIEAGEATFVGLSEREGDCNY